MKRWIKMKLKMSTFFTQSEWNWLDMNACSRSDSNQQTNSRDCFTYNKYSKNIYIYSFRSYVNNIDHLKNERQENDKNNKKKKNGLYCEWIWDPVVELK